MTNAGILSMLKSNLQIMGTAWDEYLTQLVEVAKREIEREGIELYTSDVDDVNLIVMYASYLYRKRNTDGPMPRMLRYALNNRLFAGKLEDEQ